MLFSKSAIIAAVAVSANGFLLPSSLDPVAASLAAPAQNQITESTLVALDCPGCPFYEGKGADGKEQWSQTENYLVLNFTVDGNKLLMNDRQIHPVTLPPPLHTAHQVPSSVSPVHYVIAETVEDASGRGSPFHSVRLGTATLIREEMPVTDDSHIATIKFKVGEVEGRMVDGINVVELKLVQFQGKTSIQDFSVVPEKLVHHSGGKIQHPCHKMHGKSKHGHHGHKSHRHGGKFHRFVQHMVAFTMNVVVPVLVGATAGVTVGLTAVVISQALVMLWGRLTGRGYVRLEQEDEFVGDVKEALPVYEEVIVVSEKENVQ